jgi:AcrR family transcriptional regulator
MSQISRPAPAVDGRTARRDRNRIAVLDAVLELFASGDLKPSPEAVARRSGLSLRSVYRYVADSDGLIHAAIDRHLEKVGPLFAIRSIGAGTFHDRVEAFVAARLRLYQTVAATARAAALRAPTSDILRERLDDRRRLLRAQLEQQFAPEIAALRDDLDEQAVPAAGGGTAAIVAAADALTQIETMEWFLTMGGYGLEQTHAALAAGLVRLLGPRCDSTDETAQMRQHR